MLILKAYPDLHKYSVDFEDMTLEKAAKGHNIIDKRQRKTKARYHKGKKKLETH